jgi:hypothetical protein
MTIRGYSFPVPEKNSPAIIDARTTISGTGSVTGRFADLLAGDRIRAKYRMGWDALHALEVKKLDE